jgi:hypothetical protein
MIVGFTGTHKGMTQKQKDAVKSLLEKHKPTKFHHGDCVGADKEAHEIATQLNISVIIHPPEDPSRRAFCKAANICVVKPHIERDHDIVNACSLLIGTPKDYFEELRSGTWATIRYAKKCEKHVNIVWPEGRIQNIEPLESLSV